MYELRQIQYGERLVTSKGHTNAIDNFFAKHLQVQEAKLESVKENVPANVEDVDEIRPETVVVEIQGLVEQQRVSNILGTAFKRRLEMLFVAPCQVCQEHPDLHRNQIHLKATLHSRLNRAHKQQHLT